MVSSCCIEIECVKRKEEHTNAGPALTLIPTQPVAPRKLNPHNHRSHIYNANTRNTVSVSTNLLTLPTQ
jgi:hypothetical protein